MSTLPAKTLGRNDPCHCGSGKKYKSCCPDKDEAVAREARAKAEAEASVPPPDPVKSTPATPVRPPTRQPWRHTHTGAWSGYAAAWASHATG